MRSLTKFAEVALAAALFLLPVAGARRNPPNKSAARKKTIADLKEMGYAGDVMAQVRLGVIYLTGDGVPKDDVEAVKWLRMAADQDNPVAERYLAEMYFKGRGVAADNEEAAKWLRMAAEQGDAQSQYNLAVLYSQGEGVPRNLKESLSWMTKAAEQNLAAGQMGLGVAYGNGDGVLAESGRGRGVVSKSGGPELRAGHEQSRHAAGDHDECQGAESEAGDRSGDSGGRQREQSGLPEYAGGCVFCRRADRSGRGNGRKGAGARSGKRCVQEGLREIPGRRARGALSG